VEPQLSLQSPGPGDVTLPEQADDDAVSSCPAGATGAVEVVSRVGGRVEVDHQRHSVDVYTSCRDVRGHQSIEPSGAKRGQGSLPLALAAVAVDRSGGQTESSQALGQSVGPAFGAAEHQRRSPGPDGLGCYSDPVIRVHRPEVMVYLAPVRVGDRDVVAHRRTLGVLDQFVDGAVQGGRKKQSLAARAGVVHDSAHGGQEPHIGHAVRLVYDDHLDEPEIY
jgi:hypothetical protein